MASQKTIGLFYHVHKGLMALDPQSLKPKGDVQKRSLFATEFPPSIWDITEYKPNAGGDRTVARMVSVRGSDIYVEERVLSASGNTETELGQHECTPLIIGILALGADILDRSDACKTPAINAYAGQPSIQ